MRRWQTKIRSVKRDYYPNFRRMKLVTILTAIKVFGISRRDKDALYDLAWKNDGSVLERLISGEAIYDT